MPTPTNKEINPNFSRLILRFKRNEKVKFKPVSEYHWLLPRPFPLFWLSLTTNVPLLAFSFLNKFHTSSFVEFVFWY